MPCLVGSLTRAATRRKEEKLNILTFPTHERTETNIALTGHNFYAMRGPGIKDWNTNYAPVPSNYTLLNPQLGTRQIPTELDFDLVLSQNKAGQFPVAIQIVQQLHLPLISLEHTLPMKEWTEGQLQRIKRMRGDVNVFISEYSRDKWGWKEDEAKVIHHGINTNFFKPNPEIKRERVCLSVVNDWMNRDWCCGFNLWKDGTNGVPVKILGDTPGLSKSARNTQELLANYQSSLVFINTSLISPIPTALLEAMACGCAIITTGNCMIPDVVKHGVNGCIANAPEDIAFWSKYLLNNPEKAEELGVAARQTILDSFSMSNFVSAWNQLFYETANIFYTGESL